MKTMKIRIQNRYVIDKELRDLAKKIDKNKKKSAANSNEIIFESLSGVRMVFTDKRLDVWRTIRDNKPESITHLAEILDRGYKPVYRDILLLKSLGLIELIESSGTRGNVQKLKSCYDEILLQVA